MDSLVIIGRLILSAVYPGSVIFRNTGSVPRCEHNPILSALSGADEAECRALRVHAVEGELTAWDFHRAVHDLAAS